MMRKLIAGLFLFFSGANAQAQDFRPYHAFGVQVNANMNSLSTEHFDTYQEHSPIGASGNLWKISFRFDVFGSYDYGLVKWFGLSSGIGLSMRGGASESRHSGKKRRDLFYLNVPVKLQFKPFKFLWVEPGVETKYLLGYTDTGYPPSREDGPFDPDYLNSFDLTGTFTLRFNLFRGLSISTGYHQGLFPTATVELKDMVTPQVYATTIYTDLGFRIGLRYMFDQPR